MLIIGVIQGYKIIFFDLYENGMFIDGEFGKFVEEYNDLYCKWVKKVFKFFECQLGIKFMCYVGKEYFFIEDCNKFVEIIKSMVYFGFVFDDNVLDFIEML